MTLTPDALAHTWRNAQQPDAPQEAIFEALTTAYAQDLLSFDFMGAAMAQLSWDEGHRFFSDVEHFGAELFSEVTTPDQETHLATCSLFCIPVTGDVHAMHDQLPALSTDIARGLRLSGLLYDETNTIVVPYPLHPSTIAFFDPTTLASVVRTVNTFLLHNTNSEDIADLTAMLADLPTGLEDLPPHNARITTIGQRYLLCARMTISQDTPMDILHEDFLDSNDADQAVDAWADYTKAMANNIAIGLPVPWSQLRATLCAQMLDTALETARFSSDINTLVVYQGEDEVTIVALDDDNTPITRFTLPLFLLMSDGFDFLETMGEDFTLLVVDNPNDLPKLRLSS